MESKDELKETDIKNHLFYYFKLYAEDMSRKIFKVKAIYLRHDPFIFHFDLSGNFPIVKNNCLQLAMFLIKDIH